MAKILKRLSIPFIVLSFVIASLFIGLTSFEEKTNAAIGEDIISFYLNNTVFSIDDISDWQRLTTLPNNYDYNGKKLILNCDIDTAMYPSTALKFVGILDGNNHKILNSKEPLFPEIGVLGQIKDLQFYNANITGNAVVTNTNKGIIENVSATGTASSRLFGGLVYSNNGTIKNCFSYLTINDITTNTRGNFAGIAALNYGIVTSCHYAGTMNLTNEVNAGGIVALNLSTIEKCSSKIALNIFVTKAIDTMFVGGIVGTNGYNLSNIGVINNSYSFVTVKYVSENTLNFSTRALVVAGLIGKSAYTEMEYCYSSITGEGNIYGILSHTEAQPIKELVVPEEPEEPYYIIIDYEDFYGTKDITNCYSTAELAKILIWTTFTGNIEETLPISNEQITLAQLLNNDITTLLSLLQNPKAVWQGTANQFPTIIQTIFDEAGTAANPFLIENAGDVFKINLFLYNESLSFYFEQVADIDFYGINNLPFDMGESFASSYEGNEFAIHNYSANALFNKNIGVISRLGFIGGNGSNVIVLDNSYGNITNSYTDNTRYGTLYTKADLYGGRNFVLSETFGYTENHTFTNITKDYAYSAGDGTEINPYIITTKAQLAGIGSLSSNEYAVLGNDIKINSSTIADKVYLNIAGFSGELDGKNHSIIGLLNEPLIRGTMTGRIKNVKIRGIITGLYNTGMLANTITDLGKAENIGIYGSLTGSQNGGITGSNEGTIVYCRNFATLTGESSAGIAGQNEYQISKSANYGICPIGITNNTATGTIENSFDGKSTQAMYNGLGTLNSSLRKTSISIELWHENSRIYNEESFPIVEFRRYAQYSTDIWGYEVGTNSCPEIKRQGRIYKNDNAKNYFSKVMNNNRVYSSIVSTIISTVEYDLVTKNSIRNQISFEWFYNEIPFNSNENPYIIDAGTYKVLASYPGDRYTFEYTHVYSIKISRATLPTPDFIAGGQGIAGITMPYVYDGETYNIHQIKAFNLDSIGVTEDDYSYTIKKNGQSQPNGIIDSGRYFVTIRINNKNYTEYNTSTYVEISKANLTISVEDKEIDYLSPKPAFTYLIAVQTNIGTDEAGILIAQNNAESAINEATGQAVCEYIAGDDIGEYDIGFDANLANYNLTVNKGTLKVMPIPLTTENIIYENQEKIYTSYIIKIEPNISDENITVEYIDSNTNKNVGSYDITARFSKQNFIAVELVATLSITPAPLTIKPADNGIPYGSLLPQFQIGSITFLGNDTVSSITGTAEFTCSYKQGDNVGIYDIFVQGFSSQNYNISYSKGYLTVNKAYMTNIFVYNSTSFVYDGNAKTLPIDLLDYAVAVEYLYYKDAQLLDSAPIDSGIYDVTAFVQPIGSNYRSTPFSATLTITKGNIPISFLPNYTIDYDGIYHNIAYDGTLPNAEEWTVLQTGRNSQLVLFSSFKDAGTYNITTVFSGNKNYNNKTLTTKLTITPKQLAVVISQNGIYNRQNQIPLYDFDGDIIENDTVNINWQYSLLGYGYEFATSSVMNAGSYTTYPQSQNINYEITNNPIFTIERLKVPFVPNYVEYHYGDYIDFEFNNRNFTSSRTSIIQRGCFIEQTSQSIDVEYFYSGPSVGTYNVTNIRDTENYDFELAPDSGLNKIRVMKRELTHTWNLVSATREYNGGIQQPFTVTIGNVVSGESVSTIIKSSGNLKDVGTYDVWVELSASLNYSITSSLATLEITKAPLTIKANNITVVKGTERINYTATVTGLKGGDTISSMGKQIVYNCTYNNVSPIGITLPISITEFVLENYEITFIVGILSVSSNQYSPMSMSNKTFVYDGNLKALTLNQSLPSGATVSYQNNFKTNVGTYTVTATILFPNSTMQTLVATLTITKAVPALFVEDLIIPYSIVAKIKNNDIIGIAMLGMNEIEGSFSFVSSDKALRNGINEYEVMFTPTNSQNISTASTTINVEGKAIREEVLIFDSESTIVTGEDIYITEATNITLSETYDNLQLFLNGQPIDVINMAQSGTYKIEVKYDGNIVYSKTFSVTLRKNEEEDDEEITIPEDVTIFDITGGTFTEDGNILVENGPCYITIKEDYSDMELFVNGESVEFIVLYGKEDNAKIQIKYKGLLIYSQTFGIEVPVEEIVVPPIDNWLWAKVVGGIVAGLGLGALSFFGIKKIIKKRGKSYNPYETVEKKKKKFKKYQ